LCTSAAAASDARRNWGALHIRASDLFVTLVLGRS